MSALADLALAAVAEGTITSLMIRRPTREACESALAELKEAGAYCRPVSKSENLEATWWQGCAYLERISIIVSTDFEPKPVDVLEMAAEASAP